MRPTFSAILTFATLALAACGGETPPPQPPPPPAPAPLPAIASAAPPAVETPPPPAPPKPALSEVIPQVLKRYHEAWNAHDAAKMGTFMTDDVVAYAYGLHDHSGKGDFTSSIAKGWQTFPDAKTGTSRVFVKGNVAVVELAWTGTMTGEMGETKPTNRPVGQRRVHVYFFTDDGLVKEVHQYFDAAGLRAQMKGEKNAPPLVPLPTGDPEVHVAKGAPDEDKLVGWAKQFDEALSTDDAKKATALLADDVEYDPLDAPALKGKKANAKALESFFKAFPDQKWTPTNVWGVDGFVVVEHVFTGTPKLPFGRFTKVTGKPVTGEHVLEIWQPNAEGKLLHAWSYSNPTEALKQVGAVEKTPETPAAGRHTP